jgi:hypothetical protein
MLGYPPGTTSGTHNYPFVRQGLISTPIDQEIFTDKMNCAAKAFFIDSTAVPGCSGSPVFIRPIDVCSDMSNAEPTLNFGSMPIKIIGVPTGQFEVVTMTD